MLTNVLLILLGVVLTAGTAVFVAAEFSLVALDRATVEQKAKENPAGLHLVLRALRNLSTQLSGAQIGITLTTILLGYTTQVALVNLLSVFFNNIGVVTALSSGLALVIAAILVNLFSMLFGELVPKNLALADPLLAARAVAPVQLGFTWFFSPLIKVLNGSANAILRSVGIEPKEELSSARSATELAAMVKHSADEGTLDEGTADLLTKSVMMGNLTAIDVMTDRGRVVSLPEDATAQDIVDLAGSTGHSRFPVIGSNSDDIVALVNLRRAIAVPFDKRMEVPVLASSLSIEPARVPETMKLAPLLVKLRDESMQMAVVVDEYGGTSGVVTLEDVVEEIVGEVSDEHDRARLGIRQMGPGQFRVPGTLRPDELFDRTGIKVPADGPYETLAGLIMNELGEIPKCADIVTIGHVQLEVKAMDGRRVATIIVSAPEVDDEDEVRL